MIVSYLQITIFMIACSCEGKAIIFTILPPLMTFGYRLATMAHKAGDHTRSRSIAKTRTRAFLKRKTQMQQNKSRIRQKYALYSHRSLPSTTPALK